jgi:hypothetical protein
MNTLGPILAFTMLYVAIGSVVVVLTAQSEYQAITLTRTAIALLAWPIVATIAAWRIARGRPGPWL